MDRVRIGVVGAGGMGSGHCAGMRQIPEAELAAVCDIVPAVARSTGETYGIPSFSNHADLLDSGLVEAVIIATPHYFHPPIAEAAFERGIHVLSEKPISVDVSSADRMIQAAEKSAVAFGVMYQMRSLGRVLAAVDLIQSGRLGAIYRTSLIMGWYRSQAYYNSGGWRATWTGEGGGVLINQAPHFLDLYSMLGGMPSRISGTVRTRLHDIEVEDEAFAVLDYPNGAHGYLYASTTEAPGHEMLEICGDRGKLVIHGSSLRFFELATPIREHVQASADIWGGPEVSEVRIDIPLGGGQHTDITRNFCRHILAGEPLISPGRDGIHAVELMNAIYLSSDVGGPVCLPVDRAAYAALLARLQSVSKEKTGVVEQRVTDTHYTNLQPDQAGRTPSATTQ